MGGLATETEAGTIAYYREAELKHGRTCMLAVLGIIVGETLHPFIGAKAPVDILGVPFQFTPVTSFFSAITAAFIMTTEIDGAKRVQGLLDGDKSVVPGDLGFDPLGLKPKDEKGFLEIQNKEILNGRLAMIATIGVLAAEGFTGQKTFR